VLSSLSSFESELEQLLAFLTTAPLRKSAPRAAHSAANALVEADKALRKTAQALVEHQALAAELASRQAALAEKRSSVRQRVRELLDEEEKLMASVDRVEKELARPRRPVDAAQLLRYARFLSPSTSAPPEWRSSHPLSFKVMPFHPPSHEISVPPPHGHPSGEILNLPSMVRASWLEENSEQVLRGEGEVGGQPEVVVPPVASKPGVEREAEGAKVPKKRTRDESPLRESKRSKGIGGDGVGEVGGSDGRAQGGLSVATGSRSSSSRSKKPKQITLDFDEDDDSE